MTQENYHNHLEELSKSDFEIVDNEPYIIGWKVINETGAYIGIIRELLFDHLSNSVRYIIIDLSDNGMHLDHKKVMIPIGLAELLNNADQVILPNIHIDQFNELPNYETGKIGPDTEMYVRTVIGSPAALRMEETIIEYDQYEFYKHHHFEKEHFYQRDNRNERIDDKKSPAHQHNSGSAHEGSSTQNG